MREISRCALPLVLRDSDEIMVYCFRALYWCFRCRLLRVRASRLFVRYIPHPHRNAAGNGCVRHVAAPNPLPHLPIKVVHCVRYASEDDAGVRIVLGFRINPAGRVCGDT